MPKRELLVSLAVGAAASVLAWLRLDGRTRGVVWAEDGMFLQDRLEAGPLISLVDPYGGYLHLVPRAIVEVAALVPLQDYAVAVTGLCCLTVGAVAGLVHACSRDVVESRAARVVLGLVTVLVPTAAAEVLGNTANLHWFLLWLTPWVLLCRPTSWRQGWALGAVLLAVTLTEIQAVYFAPAAPGRRQGQTPGPDGRRDAGGTGGPARHGVDRPPARRRGHPVGTGPGPGLRAARVRADVATRDRRRRRCPGRPRVVAGRARLRAVPRRARRARGPQPHA